jgi:hypothetical protein
LDETQGRKKEMTCTTHPVITFQVNLQPTDAFSHLAPERYSNDQGGAIDAMNANVDTRSIGIPGVGFFKHGEKFTVCGQLALQIQAQFANDPNLVVCDPDDTCVFDIGEDVGEAATGTAIMLPTGIPTAANPGAGYDIGTEHTVVGGTFTEAAVIIVSQVKTVLGQDETNFVVSEFDGSFTGGTGYIVSETLTMSDGTVVVVDAVSSGVITQFHITSISTSAHGTNWPTLTQSFTSGEPGGSGFTLTLDTNNQGAFTGSTKQTAEIPLGRYTVLPTNPVSVTPAANIENATFNVDWGVFDVTITSGGDGYAEAPAVSFSGGTGTTTAVASLTGDVVSNVTVTGPGSGYTETAVVTFAGP